MTRRAHAGLLLLFLAATCACRTSPDLQALFDSASGDLLRGDLARVRDLSRQGIDLARTENQSTWEWKFRLLEAEARLFAGERSAPAALGDEVPAAAEFGWVRAKQRYLRGYLQLVEGSMPKALDTLAEASSLAKQASARDIALDAEAMRGQILLRSRRWEEAEATLSAVADDARSARDEFHEAVAHVNLGMGRLARNRFDEALAHFDRTLSFSSQSERLVYARALINAGLCLARLGDFDRALSLLERAVTANEHRDSPVYLEQALGELGNTHLQRGVLDQGIPYLKRAFQVARDARINSDAAVWATNLAVAYIELRQWDEADQWNEQARLLRGDARPRPYHLVNQAKIAAGRGKGDEAERLFAEARTIGADDPAIQWQADAGVARIQAARGESRAAAMHFDRAIGVIERTRSELLKADYKLSLLPRLLYFYRDYIDFLVGEQQFERALLVANASRARVLAERHGVDAPARSDVAAFRRAAAQLKSVFVFYWISPQKSYAWIVNDKAVRFVPLAVDEGEVQDLVRSYQGMIVTSLGDPVTMNAAAGDRLYAALVAPLAASVPSGSRVVIVPDGALNTLNFETLPVPGPKRHYWIEDVEIAVAPSLGTLTGPRPAKEQRQPSVLLVGDPVSSDPQFPQLRFASAEIAAVSSAFSGKATVYRADQATPSRYREARPEQFGIVHFTAHAAANAESPLDSAVVLSRDGSGYKLYARDVADQPLTADLVTISACRSAGERAYAGEGLVGFAWAFLRAGARRVIAGLWDVDDRSTALLMGRLYALIAGGQSPAAALRAAKLEMISRGGAAAKPYYWAPFQVFVGSQVTP